MVIFSMLPHIILHETKNMKGLVSMGSSGGDDFHAATSEPDELHSLPPLPLASYTQLERAYSQDNYGGFSTPSSFDPESNALFATTHHTESVFTSAANGPLLPDPVHMQREEGAAAFREWRRQNVIYLEEKEKEEKELRNQVIAEANEFKRAFIKKRQKNIENNTALNIEREKLYLKNHEKFHMEEDKQYWKAIAELIPHEVANIVKRRAKTEKEDEKKPGIVVIQGPKPGKPTDLSRMRQLCTKLKQNPPLHMIAPETDTKDQSSKQKPEKAKPNE